MQDHFDNFFEDVFVECEDKYGQVRVTVLLESNTTVIEKCCCLCVKL